MNAAEPGHSPAGAAAERLALTRLHLQQALGGARPQEAAGTKPALPLSSTSSAQPSATPAAQLLLATLRAWWARHPLHTVGRLALQAADAAARPVAQQHPFALLLAAAACGAALAWARPWRQLNPRLVMAALVPGVLPGLLPGLMSSLMPLLTPSNAAPLWTRLLGALLPSAAPLPPQAAPVAPVQASASTSQQAGSKKA